MAAFNKLMTDDFDKTMRAKKALAERQTIATVLNQAISKPLLAKRYSRRTFLKSCTLPLFALLLPGCSESSRNMIKGLAKEGEFQQFFAIIFPAGETGLENFVVAALQRLENLVDDDAHSVAILYRRFKINLWMKTYFGIKPYNKILGETIVSEMLHSDNADSCHHALDIIYREFSQVENLAGSVWGRKYSQFDKKCVYWENYDQSL